jgi:hypothetical protein
MNSTDDRALRNELESFLKENPRLFSMLFAGFVLLSQAGSATAVASYAGP